VSGSSRVAVGAGGQVGDVSGCGVLEGVGSWLGASGGSGLALNMSSSGLPSLRPLRIRSWGARIAFWVVTSAGGSAL